MELLIHIRDILKLVFNPPMDRQYFFKNEVSGQLYSSIEDEDKKETLENKWHILCAECSQPITADSERVEINGSHEHTFANPCGLIFQIGCFARVFGTNTSGQATEQWSWFKGYRWKIVCCSMCSTHLGWVYMSSSGINFFGLILSRLSRLN